MPGIDKWRSEELHGSPAEHATELARDPFWRDEQQRLIGTHPEFPDVAWLLDLTEELAHALLLTLSRLPGEHRTQFAEVFFAERHRGDGEFREFPSDPRGRLAAAATIALLVLDLAVDELRNTRIADLLTGAAQGDDLTRTPWPAVVDLQKTIVRVRYNVELEDLSDPHAAASFAVAEVLDPAGDVVELKAVVARASWAVVESWESPRVLAFLLRLATVLDPCNSGGEYLRSQETRV